MDLLAKFFAAHEDHQWEEIGPCVYCKPCGVRLYQGSLPQSRDPGRVSRQAACIHDWDAETGLGFYFVCRKCRLKEWAE